MRIPYVSIAVLLAGSTAFCFAQRIEVTVPAAKALNGHLVLVFAKNDKDEPRDQLSEDYLSAQGFGVDVEDLAPGKPALRVQRRLVSRAARSPISTPAIISCRLSSMSMSSSISNPARPSGCRPTKAKVSTGTRNASNPYNKPVKIHFDPKSQQTIKLTLDQVIPPIEGTDKDPAVMAAKDPGAKWLKYMRFRSEKLSRFWGRDVFLGAWILLPDGFDDHPDAKYPLIVYQDHYHAGIGPVAFVTTAPDPKSPGSRRLANGYRFFQDWTAGRLPRVILIYVQNANPYYDDSYDVDSANVGPYGSAINEELIPAIETAASSALAQGWAPRHLRRFRLGGWEALATQVFYPDMYNGTWAACPDPIDFHAYQNIDLYNDNNAFVRKGDFAEIPIAGDRHPDGTIVATAGGEFGFEYALGTHGRSTEQWNIWQAVFSPAGADGYPAQIIDPVSGDIDKKVLEYWHDHYDLTAILKRDWPTLGPKLEGKLHLAVGDGDTYFLNNAVHLLQKELEATRNPHSDATFQYGPGMPHCYTGGPSEYTMQQNNIDWIQRVLAASAVDHCARHCPGRCRHKILALLNPPLRS